MIDATVHGSPGWWMLYCYNKLRQDEKRFALLTRYMEGNPPLPEQAANAHEAVRTFIKRSRTNFAGIIVANSISRLGFRLVRTAADSDENGDRIAWDMWLANEGSTEAKKVHEWAAIYGRSAASVGAVDPETGYPVIKAEDPRETIVIEDPARPGKALAAFKLYHDEIAGEDLAILWLPGQMWVATMPRNTRPGCKPAVIPFSTSSYTMDPDRSTVFAPSIVPVIPFENPHGCGEFEKHLDLIERIYGEILNRLTINAFQAFRQRALRQTANPTDEADGKTIDRLPEKTPDGAVIPWDEIFAAGPNALWKLPPGVDIWESAQADTNSILAGVRTDVMELFSVCSTPLPLFFSDAVNAAAAGYEESREALIDKTDDKKERFTPRWTRMFAYAFSFMGDQERSRQAGIQIDWTPSVRYTLQDKAQAAAMATSAGVPWRARGRVIWQFDPDELDRQELERQQDMALAAAFPTGQQQPPQLVMQTGGQRGNSNNGNAGNSGGAGSGN